MDNDKKTRDCCRDIYRTCKKHGFFKIKPANAGPYLKIAIYYDAKDALTV